MKAFHHSSLLWTTLRLGLGKIGSVMGAVCQNLSERALFAKDKHIWSQITWSVYVQD